MKVFSAVRNCTWFFIALIIILSACIFMLIFMGNTDSFFFINHWHPAPLNQFFAGYTFVGEGKFALVLIVLAFLFHKQKQLGFALLDSFLISGIAAQVIKHMIPSPRPKLFFKPGDYQHFIDGITLMGNNSFPSGHTATAFALAAVLVIMLKEKRLQLFILIAAVLVGYSRVYLGQHFLPDVVAGAIAGTLSGILSVHLAYNTKNIRLSFRRMPRIETGSSSLPLLSSAQSV